MAHFILEVGTEEMPARFVPGLLEEMGEAFDSRLKTINVPFESVRTMGTPRRLVVSITGLQTEQDKEERVVTGPPESVAFDKEGNPTKAGTGFVKSQGVTMEDTFLQDTEKGAYLAVKVIAGGEKTLDLLPTLCRDVITGLSFPKKMRWTREDFAFGRPIRWILALLDDQTVPFSLAMLQSDNKSYGHRVMGPGPWEIPHADAFVDVLEEQGRIVLDPDKRKQDIMDLGNALAQEAGGKVIWNDELLEQVVNLVEYPLPVLGSFDSMYLELPAEVLLTSMESHQKSFGLRGQDGLLLPNFLTTLNIEPKDLDVVRKGWERVLKARLEDARFFWQSDLDSGFNQWLEELDNVVYLGPLGSMGDKSLRLEKMCLYLSEKLLPEHTAELARAGRLSKADLVSEMVGEFADLQGIMGGIYARTFGEPEVIARSIYEHYLPTGHHSPAPASVEGSIVSMADKADVLAGCFGLNKIPTGANDPYALRRSALGICRLILEHKLRLSLSDLLSTAFSLYEGVEWKNDGESTLTLLLDFFSRRLKAYFQAEGHDTRQVDAVIGAGIDDIWALYLRLESLSRFGKKEDFSQAVLTFKRASNIIRKQGQEAGEKLTGSFDKELLEEPAEVQLAAQIDILRPRFDAKWKEEDFDSLFAILRELRPYVDDFFDNVMVMCEDEKLRINRLNLLQQLVSMLGRLADFSALQV